MSVLSMASRSNPAIICPAPGVSEESRIIQHSLERFLAESRRPVSFAWRDLLLGEVGEIVQSCSTEGWDGYDAEPVSRESGLHARQLIGLLPDGIQAPNVVPEPTGDIGFEWFRGNEKHFTLSISGPAMVYAGIFGGSRKRYGEERFFGELPDEILDILTGYFSEA